MRFLYYKGVRYVAAGNPAPSHFARCGSCGRAWDDDKPTALTPAPSGRCPFEHMHASTRAEYVVQGRYPGAHGWEDVTAEDSRSEARQRLKEYRENCPEYPHRLITRRVPV